MKLRSLIIRRTLLFIGIFVVNPQWNLPQFENFSFIRLAMASAALSADQIKQLRSEISSAKADDKEAVKKRVQLARHYYQKKDHSKIIDFLRPVVDSLDVSGLRLLAKAYSAKEDHLQVIRILENLIQRYKNDYVSYARLGKAYFASNNCDEGSKNYAKALSINKRYRPAYDGLLECLDKMGKRYEYRNTLFDMISVFGEKPDLMNLLCKTYYEDGFLDDARKVCQRALQASPETAENHVYYGLSLDAAKNSKRAMAIIKKAAQQYPDSEFAQYTAADMFQKNSNSLSAYKFFRRCTKADDLSSRCWLGLANMAFEVKNFKESLEAYKKSCDLDRSVAVQDFRQAATKLKLSENFQWKDKFNSFALKCRYQSNRTKKKTY